MQAAFCGIKRVGIIITPAVRLYTHNPVLLHRAFRNQSVRAPGGVKNSMAPKLPPDIIKYVESDAKGLCY